VGDFNYRIDSPPGFEPEPETPEGPSRNEQLYGFVHAKVGRGGGAGAAGQRPWCALGGGRWLGRRDAWRGKGGTVEAGRAFA
jgi:hypothetical protein